MDRDELLARADLNLLEYTRDMARWTAGGIVHEEGGLAFFATGHRFPVGMSGSMRTDPRVPAAEVIARTREAGNAGFAMGAKVAALQASTMGEPIDQRMGYREFTRYPWYVEMP